MNVNQNVSLPNDFTSQVVSDLILTLSSGNTLQGSFTVGSVAAGVTSSNAISSITGIRASFSPSGGGGGSQFDLMFTAITNFSFSVWASTNLVNWQWAGAATEINPGHYQFFDPASTNAPSRFYRISAP